MPKGPESNQPNHEWRAPKPQPKSESAANPFALLSRDQHWGRELSHEEIVASLRKDMAEYAEAYYPPYCPVDWMKGHFINESNKLMLAEHPELAGIPRHESPHARLLMAWNIISQPYYRSAHQRDMAKWAVEDDVKYLGYTITLDANEGKLLSAMAEAVGIPNPFGPTPPEKK